ncbi:DNA gyrase inhibitor YacG [Candidatus Tokpelaia sp.]|uniref:DNA gyrase inhibitor YacG n=1 Tax=Candidatus Tokpelaia sp. TaxID=2233777 RepID=UPI00123AFE62|nr:DNA gyrase inhibitor YacG [Candidatus Tokpelaia sp.]KAA6404640.1 DNA gyrase inhibitor YacG [Candidatus Tokpelaia sp.]
MVEDKQAKVKTAEAKDNVTPLRAPVKCPECGKPSQRAFYPFCSNRCRSLDLNRWLSGRYILPGPKLDEEEE